MNQDVILWKPSEQEKLELFFREIKYHNNQLMVKGHCINCDKSQNLCCKQLCIIQGGSGCGKKTTLQIIANQYSIELLEYDSMSSFDNNKTKVFLNFLGEVRKKRRLNINKNSITRAIVIYDIPSMIELKFVESLKQELNSSYSSKEIINPFILLVNDSSRDTVFLNKIIDEFDNNPFVSYIKISNINKSKMKKTLTEWFSTIRTKELKDLTFLINYLSEISKGDIRFAKSMLEFYSISNFNNYLPMGKDGSLTHFHTLGKFLYNKRYPLVKWSSFQCNHDTGKYIKFLSQNIIKPPTVSSKINKGVDIDQYWDILEIDISPDGITPVDLQECSKINSSLEYNQRMTTLDSVNIDLCKVDWCKLPLGVKLDGLGKSDKFQHLEPYSISEGLGEPKQLGPDKLFPKCNRPCSYFIPEDVIAMSGCDDDYFSECLRQEFINFYCEIQDIAKAESHFVFVDIMREAVRFNYSLITGLNLSAIAARGVLDCNLRPADPKSSSGWLYQFKSLECVTNEKKNKRIREIAHSEGMEISESTFKLLLPFSYMMKHNITSQLSNMYDSWCK